MQINLKNKKRKDIVTGLSCWIFIIMRKFNSAKLIKNFYGIPKHIYMKQK